MIKPTLNDVVFAISAVSVFYGIWRVSGFGWLEPLERFAIERQFSSGANACFNSVNSQLPIFKPAQE